MTSLTKKVATVLFADIRNFTSMTENASSEEVVQFLNTYFSLWDDAAKAYNGWIDKFIGDAVMVIFDKGTNRENIQSALDCSDKIFQKLHTVKKGIFSEGRIGIGIHS
jgi:two-component system sensor histidine kinase ChiS